MVLMAGTYYHCRNITGVGSYMPRKREGGESETPLGFFLKSTHTVLIEYRIVMRNKNYE